MKKSEIKSALVEDLLIQQFEVEAAIDYLNQEIQRTLLRIHRARSNEKKDSYSKRIPVMKIGINNLQKNLLFFENNIRGLSK